MPKNQKGFAHVFILLVVAFVLIIGFAAYRVVKERNRVLKTSQQSVSANKPTSAKLAKVAPEITWQRGEGGIWTPSSTPPACPAAPMFATPVDISLATSILYPGQVRSNAFKLQGGFRFDSQPNNDITVTVPMDAKLVRGSRGLYAEQGEVQYGFEFIAPCGIWYSFGHLHTLSPEFQAYADKLPLTTEHSQQQLHDIEGAPNIKKGDVIATQVGIVHTKNVFVELAVLDLRHDTGVTLRPEWAQYSNEFDKNGVCWLDLLPAKAQSIAKSLRGGDSVSGKKSDFCK